MTRDEKKELKTLSYWLAGVCLPYLLSPNFYPPRTLTLKDYCIWALIPLGACIAIKPSVTWRWLFYYATLGAVPFVFLMHDKLSIPYNIRTDPFVGSIVSGVYIPSLFLFLKLVTATMVIGLAAKWAKVKFQAKRETCMTAL